MPLERISPDLLAEALDRLAEGFGDLPAFDAEVPEADGMAAVLDEVAVRLQDNYPYFHPLYAGQMLKPPHPVARAAYALATNDEMERVGMGAWLRHRHAVRSADGC